MGYLLLALLGLGVLTALIALVTSRKGEEDKIVIGEQDCATCDGTDSRCEMTCRLEAAVNPIEYFDDEELDDCICNRIYKYAGYYMPPEFD